ncbi:MAG: carbohydrate ABC transporter permease [Spirochaetes bacterium]|nr:carbohydrate ABC transporter permease [Spirochaetota bacterium]
MKISRFNLISKIVIFIIMMIFTIFALFPFYFLIKSSLKPGVEIMRYGVTFDFNFKGVNLDNYLTLFTSRDGIYFYWYWNSIAITTFFTVLSLFLSSMVGYGFAKYDFKIKNFLFLLVLGVMMIPVEILILPLYKLTIFLKIINTYWGVILPFAVSPFAVFFFRQYASDIPNDFMDAGRIDGCNDFGIYFKIMVPLMKPAFGAMAILQTMGSWNNFVWPLIALRSNKMFTLPIGLSSLLAPYGNNYDMLMAGAVIAVIPIIIVYLFFQKYFITGLTGGIKG